MKAAVRDPDTQGRLVASAAHLFARRGIEAVPMRDIGEHAGQRNASAVQYHFGGRWELVAAILARHSETVTAGDTAFEGASIEGIVDGLIAMLHPNLADEEGRDFLRVVFELMVRYPGRWDTPGAHRGMTNLVGRAVSLLGELGEEVARARAVAMTQFVTQQMAERARLIDDGERAILDDDTFVTNLAAMSIAILNAPPPSLERAPARKRPRAAARTPDGERDSGHNGRRKREPTGRGRS